MKRAAKVCGVIILLVLLGGWLFSLWSGLTLYLLAHEETFTGSDQKEFVKGDIVSPLDGLDFDHGEWAAYIVLSATDFDRLKGRFSRNCLKLTDRETMKKMRDEWKMIYTGGDWATVESHIIFLKDDEVVFSSGIVLSEGGTEALQNRYFGGIEPQSKGVMWEYCSKFKPVYWPVVIL
jgi:hypothetical protein